MLLNCFILLVVVILLLEAPDGTSDHFVTRTPVTALELFHPAKGKIILKIKVIGRPRNQVYSAHLLKFLLQISSSVAYYLFQCLMALAAAMASIINVAVR